MNTRNRIYRAVLKQGKSPDRHLSYHVPDETNSMIRAFPADNQPLTIRFKRVNPKDVINQMSDSQIKSNGMRLQTMRLNCEDSKLTEIG